MASTAYPPAHQPCNHKEVLVKLRFRGTKSQLHAQAGRDAVQPGPERRTFLTDISLKTLSRDAITTFFRQQLAQLMRLASL